MGCRQEYIRRMRSIQRVKRLAQAAANLNGVPQAVYKENGIYCFAPLTDAQAQGKTIEEILQVEQ